MSDTLDSKLDAIFKARAERKAEDKRVKQEVEKMQEESLQAFLELQESVIRPTLESFANNLTDRGLESRVFESADGQTKGAEDFSVGTGIKFHGNKLLKSLSIDLVPYLFLGFDKAKGQVIFHFSTPAQGQKVGSSKSTAVDFKHVTEELINDEALKVIEIICK